MLNHTHRCGGGVSWLTLVRYVGKHPRAVSIMAQRVLGCLKCQGLHLIPRQDLLYPCTTLHNLPVPSCLPEQKWHCSGSQWISTNRGEEGKENPLPSPLPCFSLCPSAGLPSWSVTGGWAPPPCAPPAPRWLISAGSEGGCSCPAHRWRSCSAWHGLRWPSSTHWAHFSASCSLTPALASVKYRDIKQFRWTALWCLILFWDASKVAHLSMITDQCKPGSGFCCQPSHLWFREGFCFRQQLLFNNNTTGWPRVFFISWHYF